MSNNRKTYTVQVRRRNADGTVVVKSSGGSGAAGGGASAAALANLTARVERVEDLWREDSDNPGTIYTPYNAYSLGGISAMGRSPELPEASEEGAGGVELMTSWTDQAPQGKALGATLGVELHKSQQNTARDLRSAQQQLNRLRRAPDHHLRGGIIPLRATPGMIYRNLRQAYYRLSRSVAAQTIDLEDYFTAEQAAQTIAVLYNGRTWSEADSRQASMVRQGNVLRITLHQVPTEHSFVVWLGLPASMDSQYLSRNDSGYIVAETGVYPLPQHAPIPPTESLLRELFASDEDYTVGNLSEYRLQLQRRRKVQRHYCNRYTRKWTKVTGTGRILPLLQGVYRVRYVTRRGRKSAWVYILVRGRNRRGFKIIGRDR